MTKRTATILHILAMLAAAAVLQIFLVLCTQQVKDQWAQHLYVLTLVLGTLFNVALFLTDIVCFCLGKQVVYKACITAYVLFLFAGIVIYVLMRTGFMEIMRDEEALKDYLARSGGWMSILFVTLQFLQVVVLPIPSFVTVAAGTALFGPVLNTVYSLIGIVLGSVVAFLVGRYAGYPVVAWMIGKETLDKWLGKVKGKDKLLLSAMFLLPVFPDDILCFVAGLSSMSFLFFLIVILISRVLAVATTSFSVSLIPFNTWWGITIWCVFFALIIILFVFLYKRADAIQAWFEKKLHRETRIIQKTPKDEFTVQIVSPDGAVVEKGVKKEDDGNSDKKK